MEISFPTMIYTAVNFLLLVGILWFALYRPLGNFLRKREERIQDDVYSAKQDMEEAERLRKEYEAKMIQLDRDVHDVIERARWQGETEKQEIISKAREEALEMVRRAEKQIDDERIKAWNDLKDEVVDISMLAAAKVLDRIVDGEDQRRLFERFVADISIEKIGEFDEAG